MKASPRDHAKPTVSQFDPHDPAPLKGLAWE
jgi:hypothetical protein